MKDPWARPFNQPVDPVLLNIPDYPNIIKHPMDFGTVHQVCLSCFYAFFSCAVVRRFIDVNHKQRMIDGTYKTPDDFISDMRLVFRNAFVYNRQGTDVWNMAEKLSRQFEQKLLGTVAVWLFKASVWLLIVVLCSVCSAEGRNDRVMCLFRARDSLQ